MKELTADSKSNQAKNTIAAIVIKTYNTHLNLLSFFINQSF